MNDPNREAIYCLDVIIWGRADAWWRTPISLQEWRNYARRIYRESLRCPMLCQTVLSGPVLKVHNYAGQGAAAFQKSFMIAVHEDYRFPWVALHEVAHILTPNVEWHGTEFITVYRELIRRHATADVDAMFDRYFTNWGLTECTVAA